MNDKIPELKTTATIDGEKEVCATEIFTLVDAGRISAPYSE